MKHSIKICFRLFLSLLLASSCVPGYAGPTNLIPSLSIRQEYNNNITFSQNNAKEDSITIVTGSVLLRHKTQRIDAQTVLEIKKKIYQDYRELNDVDTVFSTGFDARLSERVSLGTELLISKDSLRGETAEAIGVALTGDRERHELSINNSYMISEISRLRVSLDFGDISIKEAGENEINENLNIGLQYDHNLSKIWENTTGLAGLNFQRYTSDIHDTDTGSVFFPETRTDYTSDVWQMTIGLSKQATELFNFYIQSGIGYSQTKEIRTRTGGGFGTVTNSSTSDSFSGLLFAGLTYDGLYTDADLTISHDIRGSSGTNGTLERSSLSLDMSSRLTSDLWLRFQISGILNRNERTTSDDLDTLTITMAPGFRYQIDRELFISGGYRYTLIDDREDNTSKERNLFYLEIKKQLTFDID